MNAPDGATDVPSIPELVTGGVTELRNRVIPAARERVIRDFDNRRLIRELGEIFGGDRELGG